MGADRSIGQASAAAARPAAVLVGRARERILLREELAAALGGRGRLVLLGGEAGIGKTSLARDLTREAEDLGVCVLASHCYDLTNTPPYGPWLDLLDGDRLRPLVAPPAAFAGGRLKQVTDQAALFADVRRCLAELAAARPVFVLLEDLHWADPASVELLRHIAPYVGQWRVLLVVTYRVNDLTRRHPLYQHLPALVREADGMRLDLRGLDREALRGLVAGRFRLADADAERLVAYLERHAEGNPFFTVELLRALQEEGLLRPGSDRSFLGELARVVVPPLLHQVIEVRVARLGEEMRQPLAIAAVIGQEVPLDLWATVADLDDEALLAIVERAVEAQLLETDRDGTRVRFVHALTREALYEGILAPRRRSWHRRVAESLMARLRADPDTVAFHLQEAGDPRAWVWLVQAGDRAQRVYAWRTAIERLRMATRFLDGVEDEDRMRCRLACRIGWLARFSDPAGAVSAVEEAARTAARLGESVLAAELGWLRGVLLFYSDHVRAGVAEMAEGKRRLDAIETAPFDAAGVPVVTESGFVAGLPWVDAVDSSQDDVAVERFRDGGQRFRRGCLIWQLASSGQPGAVTDDDQQFVALADVPESSSTNRAAVAFTYHGFAIDHAAMGRPDAARMAWTRARELFAEFDHHALIAFSLLTQARDVGHTYAAAIPDVRRRLAAEAEAALSRAGGALRPGISPRLAWLGCFVLDGCWAEAVRILDDLPVPGNCYLRREMTDTRALLARLRGEREIAWAQIRPLFPDGPATEPGDIIQQEGLCLQRLAADLCLDEGNRTTARAWLEAHDRWLAWSGGVLGRADGQLGWARWHRAAGDRGRSRDLATEALSLAAAPEQPLVRLAAHRLLGEIDTADKQFAAGEDHLTAALDLAAACETPFERALTRLAFAELRLAAGSMGEAGTMLDEVRRICASLGAAPTLARAEALAGRAGKPPTEIYPAGLTPREVEVLRLLAQHRTDKEIAEELFVGPRTVQTHVANILNKLGVDNRRAAAAEAARVGLV
jgi:DNA-binding CsgD family transcriptional regulator